MQQEDAERLARQAGRGVGKLLSSISGFTDDVVASIDDTRNPVDAIKHQPEPDTHKVTIIEPEPDHASDDSHVTDDKNDGNIVKKEQPVIDHNHYAIRVTFPKDRSSTRFLVYDGHNKRDALLIMEHFVSTKLPTDKHYDIYENNDGAVIIDGANHVSALLTIEIIDDPESSVERGSYQYVPYNPWSYQWPWGKDTSHDKLAPKEYRTTRKGK
jgi:hypothetical protein